MEFSNGDVRVKDVRSSRKSIGEKSLKEICSSQKVVILGAGERASCSSPVMPVRSVEQKFQNQEVLIQSPRLSGRTNLSLGRIQIGAHIEFQCPEGLGLSGSVGLRGPSKPG
jgi:hypothetical protein